MVQYVRKNITKKHGYITKKHGYKDAVKKTKLTKSITAECAESNLRIYRKLRKHLWLMIMTDERNTHAK